MSDLITLICMSGRRCGNTDNHLRHTVNMNVFECPTCKLLHWVS